MNNKQQKLIAENVSLRHIISGLNIGLYSYVDYRNIRIHSKNKPGCVVLCVECNIAEDIVFFMDTESSTINLDNKNITFEQTILDFVVVKPTMDEGKYHLSAIPLLELATSNYLIEGNMEAWSLDANDFTCVEINISSDEKDIETDMNIIG